MADQRKQFRSKVIETDISNPEMRRRKINPKPKLPAVKNSVPEIRQQHISDRIVHILAVNECDKNEMMERLEIDGLSAKEKLNVGKTLNHVSILKNNMYHLKDDMWSRIRDDWKFYSPEDAIKVEKYHCKDIPSVNQLNTQNSMKNEEMDPYPSAKKQRISHFNLRSNSITEVSPRVSSGASQNLINNPANSNLHKNPESFSGLSSFSVSPEYQIKRPQVQSSNNRPVKLTSPKNISENAFGMQPFPLELNHHYQNKNYQHTSQFLASSNKEPITSVNPTSAVESVSNVLTFTSETENKSIQRTPQILSSFDEESTASANPENAVKTSYNIFSFTSECENKNTQQIAQISPALNEQPLALANPYALETLSNASTCTSECENKVTQKTPQILSSFDEESIASANPENAVKTSYNIFSFTSECENKNTQQIAQISPSLNEQPLALANPYALETLSNASTCTSERENKVTQKTPQILPSLDDEPMPWANPEFAVETLFNLWDFTTTEWENKNTQQTSQMLSSFCKNP
ncbi:hypothetical protein CEXT_378081 [Caerostris extrusa]|uniref:RNA polymerase II elongation factor ELL N-terminal domain-containing protein n=1 Tax=Caerostris extrusa TaxID=172846 RepID=A0AAV4SQ14_CAEEX|nr:hypothetical protein CEXT_378081 [Caerostris extrusa]